MEIYEDVQSYARDFKGIWIPKQIWLDKRLSALDKIILAEIDSLDCGERGCYASNRALSEFCQCSETKISKSISKLVNLGYLSVQSFDGRQRKIQSRLAENTRQTCKKCKADSQKIQDIKIDNNIFNNINNNNKDINIKKENKKEKDGNSQENQIEKLVPKGAYEEILNYLNEKTKRNFRNIETNRKHIRARFNESKSSPYTVEDFKKVIDNKCAEWLGDEKMQKYLRPETLFGRKFESYLNISSKADNEKATNQIEALNEFGTVL